MSMVTGEMGTALSYGFKIHTLYAEYDGSLKFKPYFSMIEKATEKE